MVYEVDRHEPLNSSTWDAAQAAGYIERIANDTELRFSREEYWPSHPFEEQPPPGTRFHTLYIGTAGVIWGLDYLIRLGAIRGRVDFAGIVPELIAATRSSLEARAAAGIQLGYDGLLSGPIRRSVAQAATVAGLAPSTP